MGENDSNTLRIRLQNSRVFFLESVKKSVKRAVRVLRARSARASFQTFRLTTRAYLNTQKYGLFCSLAARGGVFILKRRGKNLKISKYVWSGPFNTIRFLTDFNSGKKN